MDLTENSTNFSLGLTVIVAQHMCNMISFKVHRYIIIVINPYQHLDDRVTDV